MQSIRSGEDGLIHLQTEADDEQLVAFNRLVELILGQVPEISRGYLGYRLLLALAKTGCLCK